MGILVEIFCLIFLSWVQLSISEPELKDKYGPRSSMAELQRSKQEGDFDVERYILKHSDVELFQNKNKISPSRIASKLAYDRVPRGILTIRSLIDIKDNGGWTPLLLAAKEGNTLIVKLLLDKNATVNIQNNKGETPIHWAAYEGHMRIVEELYNRKAFLNVQNNFGNTPLNWASWAGKLDVIKFMLDNKARVDVRTYDEGWSAMHRAAERDQKDVIKEFISRDPCVLFLKDNRGNYPHAVALRSGHRGLADYLRSRMDKKLPNCKLRTYTREDLSGNSRLHWAALEGNIDAVKMILNRGNVDTKKSSGDTPLHLASKEGHVETIRELVLFGAFVDMKNNEGRTPLQLAARNGKLLAVLELLDRNATVDTQDQNGDSPLHWAAWEGHISIVKKLIDRNASVNIQNSYGNTPLSWAGWAGKIDVVQLLLRHNAQIELKTFDEGWNALHRAAERGQLAVAKVYLAKNPSLINIKDNKQRTPYEVAKENNHKELADYLLSVMGTIN